MYFNRIIAINTIVKQYSLCCCCRDVATVLYNGKNVTIINKTPFNDLKLRVNTHKNYKRLLTFIKSAIHYI